MYAREYFVDKQFYRQEFFLGEEKSSSIFFLQPWEFLPLYHNHQDEGSYYMACMSKQQYPSSSSRYLPKSKSFIWNDDEDDHDHKEDDHDHDHRDDYHDIHCSSLSSKCETVITTMMRIMMMMMKMIMMMMMKMIMIAIEMCAKCPSKRPHLRHHLRLIDHDEDDEVDDDDQYLIKHMNCML